MPSHPLHSTDSLGGCPGYVRGWCCKARDRTLASGYRDVGYLLASRVRRFRPAGFSAGAWRRRVRWLQLALATGDDGAAERWLTDVYPRLMALIPAVDRGEFVAGIRERTGA